MATAVNTLRGRALAEAVRHRPLIAEARVRHQNIEWRFSQ